MQTHQLAALISWHRRRAGLSQVELARHAGASRYVVQDLESGAGRTTWARMIVTGPASLNLQLLPQGPLVDQWRAETKKDES